jgi:hypothetical protein
VRRELAEQRREQDKSIILDIRAASPPNNAQVLPTLAPNYFDLAHKSIIFDKVGPAEYLINVRPHAEDEVVEPSPGAQYFQIPLSNGADFLRRFDLEMGAFPMSDAQLFFKERSVMFVDVEGAIQPNFDENNRMSRHMQWWGTPSYFHHRVLANGMPLFAVFYAELSSDAALPGQSGVFVLNAEEKFEVTWNRVLIRAASNAPATAQCTLYPNGTFEYRYGHIGAIGNTVPKPVLNSNMAAVGFATGLTQTEDADSQRVDFSSLPESGGTPHYLGGVVEVFHSGYPYQPPTSASSADEEEVRLASLSSHGGPVHLA